MIWECGPKLAPSVPKKALSGIPKHAWLEQTRIGAEHKGNTVARTFTVLKYPVRHTEFIVKTGAEISVDQSFKSERICVALEEVAFLILPLNKRALRLVLEVKCHSSSLSLYGD